ncbi:MAG: type II toxin-antitoxin system RelE/ParE family toxin [Algicola sp.]|nr:type II toxin-antitoxin system RelE/ParE family toxin [Algicola sp.]
MTTNKLVISPAAKEDLQNIYDYGKGNWGVVRATKYLFHIKSKFSYLQSNPQGCAVRNELLPGIRCLPVKNHNVFYQFESQQVEIIRVLQGRQSAALHISM